MTNLATSSAVPPAALRDAQATAQSYADYAAAIPAHREALDANHAAVDFTPDERAAIASIERPVRIFAVVEEWCPDVIANLPVVARAAEANPAITLHVLYRPDHRAFADAYPGPETQRSHIPTFVAFDAQDNELGVLIERPAPITEIVRPYSQKVFAEIESRFPGVERADLPKDFVAELAGRGIELRAQYRDQERAGIVDWLVDTARKA